MAPTTTYTDTKIGIRSITARTNAAGAPLVDLSAEEERYSNYLFSEGWIAPTDAFEPVKGSAATWDVIIGSGAADVDLYVVQGQGTGQGNYVVRLDQTTDTIVVDSSDVSNPRTDEVYLVVIDDAYDSTGLSLARFGYRKGDAGPAATAPGPDPAWNAYALLATVLVPASSTDILASTLTDERIQSQSTADAPTLEGNAPTDLALATHLHNSDYASQAHDGATSGHPLASGAETGFFSAAGKTKLNSIESLSEVNLTPTELRTLLLTVDGSGSGLDADTIDGTNGGSFSLTSHTHDSSYYTEAEVNADLSPLAWSAEQVSVLRPAVILTASGLEHTPLMYAEERDDWGGHSTASGSNHYISDDGAGFYFAEAQCEFAYSAGGNMRQLRMVQSGTQIAVGRIEPVSTGSGSTIVRCANYVYMTGAQAIYLYAYQDSGGNLNLNTIRLKLTKLGT